MCVQDIKPRHEKNQNARCWDEHTKFAVKIIDRKKMARHSIIIELKRGS